MNAHVLLWSCNTAPWRKFELNPCLPSPSLHHYEPPDEVLVSSALLTSCWPGHWPAQDLTRSPEVLSQQSSVSCVKQSPEPRYQLQAEQISIFRITKRTLELDPDRDTTSIVKMSRPGYKTKSDTMLLRRLINNLKERGSEVAGELERKAHNFLTDVQMKRKPVEVSVYF